jgi:hypothetical protein
VKLNLVAPQKRDNQVKNYVIQQTSTITRMSKLAVDSRLTIFAIFIAGVSCLIGLLQAVLYEHPTCLLRVSKLQGFLKANPRLAG